ncbi:MAG: FAD-binding oxidoreductase [Anaerolineales bacterium]|nr:FAD-binding oxidoreductase [Anaerolineales bacterium]
MRRWNGWGDDSVQQRLPASAAAYITEHLGTLDPPPDAELEDTLHSVPPSRLPKLPAWSLDAHDRLLHARGQSLPDWVALRSGRIESFPDAVAYPTDNSHLSELLRLADLHDLQLIPYGGGTSVVGHINPLPEPRSVTVDMRGMAGLEGLDTVSGLASFGAGTAGPEIEATLAEHGFTLGHFPQSFEYSTLGGWIATRSSGQQSDGYGRIEDLFRGGEIVSPSGALEFAPLPASATGPDLRQLVLGSEGRLGFITRAVVRVRRKPEEEVFLSVLFPDWSSGVDAARHAAQRDLPLSMFRLSDALETTFSLASAGRPRLRSLAESLLSLIGFDDEKCLAIYALSGPQSTANEGRRHARRLFRRHGGLSIGGWLGERWRRSRFQTPYLRNSLWDLGYAVDSMETAFTWDQIDNGRNRILEALNHASTGANRTLVLSHLSHRYTDAASLYFTLLFRRSSDPDRTLANWKQLKRAAVAAILDSGGTISHHHGIGTDHREYLAEEKGALALRSLEAARRTFDPQGWLNPGKLLGPAEAGP